VPVTVIKYAPTVAEPVVEMLSVVVTIDPGVRDTVALLTEAVGPFVNKGETDTVRETLPEKPRLLTYIIPIADPPTVMTVEFGRPREMAKSVMIADTVVVCFIEPTVAVTVTVYVPMGVEAVAETVRVDVPEPPAGRTGLAGRKDAVRPFVTIGEIAAEKVRVPLRRFTLDTATVDEPDDATEKEKDAGLAEMTKSPGVKMLRVEVTVLLEPLTIEIVSE
jgi:hypothetical protein